MHALIEFIAGIVAALAMAALSQFGVELRDRRADEPEVRRVKDDCPPAPARTVLISASSRKC
ncbi:MAG: hypothetical protein KJ676_09735 [Alphaproteobacteria bacterium]|nr:hypothetical protein [Alphaproteobacteria bacterium]MBU1527498.1 hypothetical protein [Alphaproteobacteria bacterium]MBU2116258.1 hypothetical protein [Alphaproteobacteria bacterium]MBU2352632.1 hypothetical protein [Alphaproteobacteria bacterium]MBU2382332.1 hypothetical protein [Alphaproteobacteria bacterium]